MFLLYIFGKINTLISYGVMGKITFLYNVTLEKVRRTIIRDLTHILVNVVHPISTKIETAKSFQSNMA